MGHAQAEREDTEDLRSLLRLHEVAVATMSHGLCMFDAKQRVVLFNQRFAEIYNMSPDVLRVGAAMEDVFRYGAAKLDLTAEQTEEGWRRRQEQLARREPFNTKHGFRDGVAIAVSFRPMPDGGWVAVHEDITKQQRMQHELRVQVDRMHQALRHLPHGLSMFDANRRLIVCNQQYLELYGFDPDIIRPGVSYREIVENWVAQGNQPVDELYSDRLKAVSRGRHVARLHRKDGRVIEAIANSMPGGGWVTVSEDITARLDAETALREQNVQFDAAIENMAQGLIMVNGDLRVLVCNHRFSEMFGFPGGLVKPSMPLADLVGHSVAAGNHSATAEAVYADLVAYLNDETRSLIQRDLATGRRYEFRKEALSTGGWVATCEDITEAQRAAEAIREQNVRFDAALENMAQGLWMLDADLRMLVCNHRFAEMYGLDPAVVQPGVSVLEIIHHSVACGNHGRASAERVYELFLRFLYGQEERVQLEQPKDGRIFALRKEPMPNGGWVVTYADVTQTERAFEALQEQNLRFDAALNNMSQGLCMFDAENRLIVCNEQYVTLFEANLILIKPGITLREVFAHGVDCGVYGPGVTADDLVARRRAVLAQNRPVVYEQELAGGRSLSITICPMANGGWVGTFEDITERRAMERERAAALAQLRDQNLRFDAALNNMSHGLCMFDAEHRVIVYNDQFLDMFGIRPEKVRCGSTLRDLLHLSAAAGNYAGRTAEDLHAEYIEKLKSGSFTVIRHLADGRVININARKMQQGGWVSTYEDITERYKTEERIAFMARHDSLTGLPNRLMFKEKMADGLARAESGAGSMAVLCLDLDNFKAVNDTLGHPIGDRLLTIVAQRLVCLLGEEAMMARLGGDEFAILQYGPQPGSAEALATRVIDVLSQPVIIDEHELISGVSIGISIAPNDGTLADHLMKCADVALYRAKAEGRGKFRFFEPDMDARLQARRSLERDLRKAIHSGEFTLVYQPQVSAATGDLTGFEALLRWHHPDRGPVSPAEFIPLAEETGLIVPLGEWVLRHACAEAAAWSESLRIAVNMSPAQFKSRGLVSMVTQALAAARLPAERLELEITEAVLLQDEGGTRSALHQLRALGIRISMDDFGTGYSSLSYLRSFPFDKIKIDRSFVHDIDRKPDGLAIFRAMTSLGESLGIETTAEGVETAEQMELIRREGCGEVQGFLISRPLTAADAERFIASRLKQCAVA